MTFLNSLAKPLLALALACGAGMAQAALVHYDEAVDGDFAITSPLQTLLFNTAGINTVVGNIGSLQGSGCVNDQDIFDCDSFGFTVAPGLRIVGLSVLTTASDLGWRVGTTAEDFGGSEIGRLMGNDALGSSALPLGAGTYNVSYDTLFVSTSGDNYRFSFDIESVPEPVPLALLGIGLLGMAVARRRRT